MRSTTATAFAAAIAVGGVAGSPDVLAQETTFVVIGTGGVTGVYFPMGGAIQRLVNRHRADHGIRVSVESTGGSIFNLDALANGEMDMAVVQSDWQYHAFNGGHEQFPEADPDLRAVFSIYPEPFHIVARADSGIESLADLEGRRVNIGNPGSGARGTMEVLMEHMGWTSDSFSQISELATAEQSQALCDGSVDAIVFAVGVPSGTIQEATTSCDSIIVPVTGRQIDRLVEENPYYGKATIPGGTYQNNPDDIDTFALIATFVATAQLPDDVVYTVVSSVFDNFDDFLRLHPAFAGLTPELMATRGISAPLHPGAQRYFEEHGLR